MSFLEPGGQVDVVPVQWWVLDGQRLPWEDVTALSVATKGLWSNFSALRLRDGVLQRTWKEPATGEERWQIVVWQLLDSEMPKTGDLLGSTSLDLT